MTKQKTAAQHKKQLLTLLTNFDSSDDADLRGQVCSLIPIWDQLRELGTTLIPKNLTRSARGRILHYFQKYPQTVISHNELMIVSGISEWARRVRELRKEFGWSIVSGIVARQMQEVGDLPIDNGFPDCSGMGPNDYILFDSDQDRDAAFRWKVANDIRKSPGGSKAHILQFLKENVERPVTGEELRYVAKDASEWARRVRELRTEDGWPISTYWNGRPELKSGMYLLEADRQQPPHDRKISDPIRRDVLARDEYTCKDCGWSRKRWNPDDPRHLELHHVEHHVDGGENVTENLLTLCNICHDTRHRSEISG